MQRLPVFLMTFVLMLAISGCGWLPSQETSLSGTIEAEEWPIVAEVGGLVMYVEVEEGQRVTKGQVLAQIDPRTFQYSVAEAKAALDQAIARLEEAKAGSRHSSIQKGVASVQQADANLQMAKARKRQADAGVSRAQELWAQVEAQWRGAEQTLTYQQNRLQEATALFEKGAISKKDLEAQQETVSQARTQVAQLAAQVASAKAQVESAEGEVAAAAAQTGTAEAQQAAAAADLDLLQEGSTDYTLRALLAAQQQAGAKLEQANLQLEKAKITAPVEGILLRSSILQGEVAKVGANLFTMMKADRLKLKVYIPEAELNRVQPGQEVGIQVDAYPGRTFVGTVSHLADKAEFTPKNVQTSDERTKLVFAVTIQITQGLDQIKPGMPADVLLPVEGEAK